MLGRFLARTAEITAAIMPPITEPITLKDFFAEAAAELASSRTLLAAHDATLDPFEPYGSSRRFSICLQIRTAAALTVVSGRKLNAGQGKLILDKPLARETLLGHQAKYFNIYDRNLDQDIVEAEELIHKHAPSLLAL